MKRGRSVSVSTEEFQPLPLPWTCLLASSQLFFGFRQGLCSRPSQSPDKDSYGMDAAVSSRLCTHSILGSPEGSLGSPRICTSPPQTLYVGTACWSCTFLHIWISCSIFFSSKCWWYNRDCAEYINHMRITDILTTPTLPTCKHSCHHISCVVFIFIRVLSLSLKKYSTPLV